jgi:peroxiredoxin
MKKLIFYILAITIVSCNKAPKTIEGSLSNGDDNTVLYLEELFPESNPLLFDSCKVKNGQFSFNIEEENVGVYKIYQNANNFAILIVKKGDRINLDMDLNNLNLYYANGSDEIEGYVKFQNILYQTKLKEDSLRLVYQKAEGTPEQQVVTERIMLKYDEIILDQKLKMENFVEQNNNNFASLLALLSLGSIDRYFDLYKSTSEILGEKYSENNWILKIKQEVKAKESTAIGAHAPDFTINDTNGNPISLSSFRGQYVLIDFWAHWCKPCRDANPNLVSLYEKYKPKGFEIIGVSLDDTTRIEGEKEKWLNAIVTDKMSWIQLSDLNGADSETAINYGVSTIPSTYLLNPEGIIIAKDLNGTLLNKKLSEIFD